MHNRRLQTEPVEPRVILFSGPACSWKSTIAAVVSARTRIPHLEMDQFRIRLMPGPRHTRAERVIALRAMNLAAELLLRHGNSVILDAQYRRSEDREEVAAVVSETGAGLFLVECAVSAEEAVRRFDRRSPDPVRPDVTAEKVVEWARDFPYSREGLVLDTDTLTVEECAARVLEFLTTEGSVLPSKRWGLATPSSRGSSG